MGAITMDKISIEEDSCIPDQVKDMADKLSTLGNILKDIPDENILEALKNM